MAISLGFVTPRWLRETIRKIVGLSRARSTGKSGSAQGSPHISERTTKNTSVITVTKFHAGRPPLDDEIKVPIGGFPPTAESARALGVDPSGSQGLRIEGDHWLFVKPEGVAIRRTRIYNRFSGQTIKKKGFVSESVRDVLTGPQGQRNLNRLAIELAQQLAREIASEIVADLNTQGVRATFTSS